MNTSPLSNGLTPIRGGATVAAVEQIDGDSHLTLEHVHQYFSDLFGATASAESEMALVVLGRNKHGRWLPIGILRMFAILVDHVQPSMPHPPEPADAVVIPDLTVVGADGIESTLHTTQHHPFWDDTSERWVDAKDLVAGHRLTGPDGQTTSVVSVRSLGTPADQSPMPDTTRAVRTVPILRGCSQRMGVIDRCDCGWQTGLCRRPVGVGRRYG